MQQIQGLNTKAALPQTQNTTVKHVDTESQKAVNNFEVEAARLTEALNKFED